MTDELDEILDELDEYNDVDRTLTIADKLAYYPELDRAKQAIQDLIDKELQEAYKKGCIDGGLAMMKIRREHEYI